MNDTSTPTTTESGAKLAYTTSTGEAPVSKLAQVTTRPEDPALQPTPRIPRKTAKKVPFSRVSAPAVDYYHEAPDPETWKMLMDKAQEIIDGVGEWAGRGYTKIERVKGDPSTLIVR